MKTNIKTQANRTYVSIGSGSNLDVNMHVNDDDKVEITSRDLDENISLGFKSHCNDSDSQWGGFGFQTATVYLTVEQARQCIFALEQSIAENYENQKKTEIHTIL